MNCSIHRLASLPPDQAVEFPVELLGFPLVPGGIVNAKARRCKGAKKATKKATEWKKLGDSLRDYLRFYLTTETREDIYHGIQGTHGGRDTRKRFTRGFVSVYSVCSVVWSPSRSIIEKWKRLFLDEVPGRDKGFNELSRFGGRTVGE